MDIQDRSFFRLIYYISEVQRYQDLILLMKKIGPLLMQDLMQRQIRIVSCLVVL